MIISYMEYLNLPAKIILILVGVFFVLQVIGELLEFKGKVVPEFFKIRKYFIRKKQECEIIHQIPDILKEMQKTFDDFNIHYSSDNICMRNEWIEKVNTKLNQNDEYIKVLNEKIDKNNEDTLSLLIDSKRNAIINFASHVIDENISVTREQFNRIFKLYEEYENIIEKNGLTNGEVDIAIRIITEAYEKHMKTHSFIEDIRGYN